MFSPRHLVALGVLAGLLLAREAVADTTTSTTQSVVAAGAPWRDIAIDDIEHAHRLIQRAHPGVLEADKPFHAWLHEGHREALALARRADTEARAWAALQFYVTGFRDGHLVAWRERQPLLPAHWAGWTVQYRHGAYRVIKATAFWPSETPEEGDVVLSCDGVAVDDLLAAAVAPFVDRRDLGGSKSRLALHLTNEWDGEPVWDRFRPERCLVQSAAGRLREFGLSWRASNDGLNGLRAAVLPQGVEALASGVHWIHVTDFLTDDQGELDAFLERVGDIGHANAVVLDTRGNNGGNSVVGLRLLRALLKKRLPAPPVDPKAYWRVSEIAGEGLRERHEAARKQEGEQGPTRGWIARQVRGLDFAMKKGEPFFAEEGSAATEDPLPSGDPFDGKLVLITDEYCASACLDFADDVRRIPNVIHVGDVTGADTRYMDITIQPLPSGARMALPLKVWRHRLRGDNEPLRPRFVYSGDLGETEAVKAWVEGTVLPGANRIQLD